MSSTLIDWEFPPLADSAATMTAIDPFNAQGMRHVYSRGDNFRERARLNLDIWRDRAGRLFVRFSSRSYEVDNESWELTGMPDTRLLGGRPFTDRWVPECVRHEYNNWVIANF